VTSRNEQFVWFTAALAVILPGLMWFRYVGPLRAGVAADERAIAEMRLTLDRYVDAELLPMTESDESGIRRVVSTREGIERLMGHDASVSEVYRGIELAAFSTGVRVVRIEPSKSLEHAEFEGPLGELSVRVESRTYRIEIEGPARELSAFLGGLSGALDNTAIREVRAQYTETESRGRGMTASVTLESLAMQHVQRKGDGK